MAWDLDKPQDFMDSDNCDVDHHRDYSDHADDHYDDDDHHIDNQIEEEDDDNKSWRSSSKWLGTLIILKAS